MNERDQDQDRNPGGQQNQQRDQGLERQQGQQNQQQRRDEDKFGKAGDQQGERTVRTGQDDQDGSSEQDR